MKLIPKTIFLLAYILLTTGAAHAQGVGSSGALTGVVVDPTGAPVPKATVIAEEADRGIRHTTVSDGNGEYRVLGLPATTYTVTLQLGGFQTEVQKGVVVGVGQTVTLDFHLKLASGTERVEVTGELPVLDTERGSQANAVSERYIMDLPIDRRDYLTFTLLMPGVSNSNTIADNADFRVKQTPQSGLSFYGSNGRGNSVTVDGGEANDDAGGVRLTLSQDGVQEFQVNRSNYSAELGGASGASINIVTNSGTNNVHGGLFGFFRNDALDARNPFAISQALQPGSPFALNARGQAVKDSLNRQQFGGHIGFPVKTDKTFLYVAYEGLRSDAQDAVPLLMNSSIFAPTTTQGAILARLAAEGNIPVPCISNFATGGPPTFLPAAVCAFGLQSILTVNPNQEPNPFVSRAQAALDPYIVNQFETNGGLFPFPIRSNEGSGRLDHRFSDRDQAFVRYSFAHLTERDPDVQALTAFNRGTSILSWDSTAQLAWFHQFSPTAQNEARVQWNWYQLNVDTNDPGGPGLDVQGFGFFGRQIFLPSHTTARRYEFADNVTLIRGHHTMIMGFYELIRGNNTTSQTFFPGRFEFLDLPGILVSACLEVPAACGLPVTLAPASINTLQSWSLGLPAFFEQGFGNPKYVQTRPFTAAYWQDQWRIRPNFTLNYGLRYELDSQYGPLHTPKTNFGPRISFAWDPLQDHKTVIRGGYGIYYSQIYAQIPGVVKTLGNINGVRQIANTLVTINGLPQNSAVNSAAIFQTLFFEGLTANPTQNRIIGCGTPPPGQFACITPSDLAQFGLTVSNTGPLPPGTVLFAGQPNYKSPTAQQASLGIDRALGMGFSVSANYVYVHTTHLPVALDSNLLPGAPVVTGLGANGLPTNGLSFQDWGALQCIANPALCFADPTHTILQNNIYSSAASAVYNGGILELRKHFSEHFTMIANYTYSKAIDESTDFNSDYAPFSQTCLRCERSLSDFDQRHKVVVAGVFDSPWEHSRVLEGFELSPIFSYNSGHPFNLLAGADINGDGHFTNDRPPAAGRNTGIGPSYVVFDMRLGRNFKLGEKASLLLTAEGFNIANHTNHATINNIVGANFAPSFNVHGTAALTPSQPLGFTSALPAREIQLGARLTF